MDCQVTDNNQLGCYLPRVVLRWLATAPSQRGLTLDGTAAFLDTSGFTKLSERLARRGDEGAELLVETINACFSSLLPHAYATGASLLKFSGDALLLWFEGEDHALRACAAAVAMRSTLRQAPAGVDSAVLRMSIGLHSGAYQMFLVGGSHREHLIAGPAASTLVAMEKAAATGQILVSRDTAGLLPARCLGSPSGPGVLLARPPSEFCPAPSEATASPSSDAIVDCLSTALRAHVLTGPVRPEHRTATVSFLQFGRLDDVIEAEGGERAAMRVDEVVRAVQEGADRYEVCILGSDITAGGATLLLSAGAPRAVGDDEERMLLTLRHAIDARPRLPIRAGVNRGRVFTGEVGPPQRRTYVAMGDTTNLAARLAAKAPWGSVFAMPDVVQHSHTRFETTRIEPFLVKGKTRPIEAVEVRQAKRAAFTRSPAKSLPLVGRDHELALLRTAVADARQGKGTLVEFVGDVGSGKSRLLCEAEELAASMRQLTSTCQVYTQGIPYSAWREPLRHLLGAESDEADGVVIARLQDELERTLPDLLPWLPLLAMPFDVNVSFTAEIDQLAPGARATKLREVVLRFLQRALVVPTLLEFEQAHLMDAASAQLLDAVAGELHSAAWLVLVTRRDVPGGLTLQAPHDLVELAPLSGAEAQTLAEATSEAAELAPHLVRLAVERAAGNPQFLLDLLAAATSGGPDALPGDVQAAATARIDALDPSDRVLVARAAVLGLQFDPRRIVDVLDPGTPTPSERDWDRLSTVFAIDVDGHLRFKRPAWQEAAYASLPFKLRRDLHAAVGRSLEQESLEAWDVDPAVLSLHFVRAGDYERGYRYSMSSAERAKERFSHADAARLYRRAIEAARATRLVGAASNSGALAHAWEQLGNALRCTGEPQAATRALREARRLLQDDPVAQARLCHRHAEVVNVTECLPVAVRWLNRGLRSIDGIDSAQAVSWRARLLSFLAGIRNRQGRWSEAARLCRAAISEAESVGEPSALAHASYALDWALVELGHPDQATHSWRALEIYETLGEPERESTVLNNLGMFAYFEGRWSDAVELYRRAGTCSERAGKPGDVAYTECNIGEILSDQGHLEQAAAYLQRARRLWSATRERQGVAFVDLLLGRVAVRAARHGEGLPLLETAMADLARFQIRAYAGFARALIAEAQAFGGDPARALSIAQDELRAGARYAPLLRRVRGIAFSRLEQPDSAEIELTRSLATSRAQGAHYDTAATVDLLDALGMAQPEDLRERDAILIRLGIHRLPKPQLPDKTRRLTMAVAG